MRPGRLAIAVMLASNSLPAFPGEAAMDLHFERGEAELKQQGIELVRPPAADALVLDCTVARRGHCSQRALVRQGGDYVSFGAHRAEASADRARALNYRPGEVWDYGFSVRVVEEGAPAYADKVSILWQFKRTSAAPDAFIGLRDGRLYLRVGPQASVTLLDPMPAGWVDVQLRVTWSADARGAIRAMARDPSTGRTGTAEYRGPTLSGDKGIGYLKWGLYKPGVQVSEAGPLQETVWHDEVYARRIEPPTR